MGLKEMIEEANSEAVNRLVESDPVLVKVDRASRAMPGMKGRIILHAGPPIRWEDMCGPMKAGIVGAVIYEGWADDASHAEKMLSEGEVRLRPCHELSAVGSMTGVTSPTMWVYVIKNKRYGNVAYSHLYEGRGKTLAFGGVSDETFKRLRWMYSVLGPSLNDAIKSIGEINVKSIISEGLHMGDECHNRNIACSQLFFLRILDGLLDLSPSTLKEIKSYIIGTRSNFFLTLAMASCKAIADSAKGIPYSTVVTAMSRNGVKFGIKVSGLGDKWFIGPAQKIKGLYFPGFSEKDANPDMGDSSITETVGLGGFAMAASPPMLQLVGITPDQAIGYTEKMDRITVVKHRHFTIPLMGFRGTPVGIDIRKVLDNGILPIINTGISHKEPGIGHIGAGLVNPPIEAFTEALKEFGREYV